MRRLLWLPLLLLMTGCILSRSPLVGPSDHVWLFGDGAWFVDLSGSPGAWADKEPFSAREVIRDGDAYRMTVHGGSEAGSGANALRFRLFQVRPDRWIVAAAVPDGDRVVWLYAHLHREGSTYIVTQLLRPHFMEFARFMEKNHAEAWSNLAHHWEDEPKHNAVYVSHLSFLRILIPHMIDTGNALPERLAFRHVTGHMEELVRRRIALMAERAEQKKSLAKAEDDLRRLCGGRICKRRGGRTIYRTDSVPHRWYDDMGRLLPQSEWPR
ncbi:MAG: hypothetical protein ACK4QW_07795 [Alphaproteobacteria bacterium]